jgi:predicted nucleic acid-binding protein
VTYSYIIDTWAWAEYFRGSEIGNRAKTHIENSNNITPTIVLAEMSQKFKEWGRTDFPEKLDFIRRRSTIVALDKPTAVLAGEIRADVPVQGMGMIDCILLAASRVYDAKVVTGDPHFRDLIEAEFIGD